MKTSLQPLITRALCGLLVAGVAACGPHNKTEVLTVQDLLDDRVKLDGIILKCNDPSASHENCAAARTAAARISNQRDAQKAAQRNEDFERRREQLRQQEDRERQSSEAQKPDAYHLPVVPVEPHPTDSPHS